jgi:hypothetical protein
VHTKAPADFGLISTLRHSTSYFLIMGYSFFLTNE